MSSIHPQNEEIANAPTLSIVIPCYDEELVLPETLSRLRTLLDDLAEEGAIAAESTLLFVDDGSKDDTYRFLSEAATEDCRVEVLKLSRNFGHQNALFAGLAHSRADFTLSMDADLQDDPAVIRDMLVAAKEGAKVVYGVRRRRDKDRLIKRVPARLYYRILRLVGIEIIEDHADFRLLHRDALNALLQFDEVHLFLRGMVPLIDFPSRIVHYDRAERFAGETKYSPRKMLRLALDGITSFSAAPLHLIAWLGVLVSLSAIGLAIWALIIRLLGHAIPGWASIVVPLYFIGGIQLLSLGVIGIYLSKIYAESKKRPRYIVEAFTRAESSCREQR